MTTHTQLGKLVLVRGVPGSGKSTLAAKMTEDGFTHLEADQWFTTNGEYKFDTTKLAEAHTWCIETTRQLLADGKNVVVANTFVKLWEMEPYLKMETTSTLVVEAKGNYKNTHNVPEEVINRMLASWEQY